MRRYEGRTVEQRIIRSLGFPLAGGAALAAFVVYSAQYWWVGPAVLVSLVLAVLVLCRA